MASTRQAPRFTYERRRPEATALYEVVRDKLETLYGAIDDGALDVKIPKHAKKELEKGGAIQFAQHSSAGRPLPQ